MVQSEREGDNGSPSVQSGCGTPGEAAAEVVGMRRNEMKDMDWDRNKDRDRDEEEKAMQKVGMDLLGEVEEGIDWDRGTNMARNSPLVKQTNSSVFLKIDEFLTPTSS